MAKDLRSVPAVIPLHQSLFYLSIHAEIVSKQSSSLKRPPSGPLSVFNLSRLTSFSQGHTQNQLPTAQNVHAPPGEKSTLLTAHKLSR